MCYKTFSKENKTSCTIKEVTDLFRELIDLGREAEWQDRAEYYRDDIATKYDIEELKQMTLASNPSYAAKVRMRSNLDKITRHQSEPQPQREINARPKYHISVRLETSSDRSQNVKDGTNILLKILQPRKNNLRYKCWLSKNSGNMVVEFPTLEECNKAKMILAPTPHKIVERKEKKVSLWCKFAQNLENESPEDIANVLSEMNSTLKDCEILVKWIGRDKKKKLKVTVPMKKAIQILKDPFVYSEGCRHPVEIMMPLPFRCGNCLQFHNCRGENCKNEAACKYCSENHEADSCPVKDDKSRHKCATCAHNHDTMSHACEAWRTEARILADKTRELMREAMEAESSGVVN